MESHLDQKLAVLLGYTKDGTHPHESGYKPVKP